MVKTFGHHKHATLPRPQLPNGAYSLTAAEVSRLIASARNLRDRVLLLLLSHTGMRRFEAATITWGDIDMERRQLTVRSGKGGKQRVIPMTSQLSSELGRLAKHTNTGLVFQSRQAFGISVRQVNRIVAFAGNRAGIRHPNPRYRDVTCHLLRHSFARLWKASGGSIETLSHLMGHSTPFLTQVTYGREGFLDVQRNFETTTKQMYKRK